jgi:hypothetical protein
MLAFSLFTGSCLNPVNFDETSLPRIPVNVSGSIDVSIKDVAVFWLINRTKTVNVAEFNIGRPRLDSEAEAQYRYPKTYPRKPVAGTSLASYHTPAESPYTVSVLTTDSATGQTRPFTFEVQFPRSNDYRYYLYWAKNEGKEELVLIDEAGAQGLPADPDKNYPDPAKPSSVDAQTFVVINVSPDQNLDGVEFVNKDGNTYVMAGEPKARDQQKIFLAVNSYVATARYTKGGTPSSTTGKNVIVAREGGGIAVKTNFVYFYKTKKGDYQLSWQWPPLLNDASDENKPEEALNDTQGILEITNNATPRMPHDLIGQVNIGGKEYSADAGNIAYMVPGDVNRYILPVGTVLVSFKSMDQNYYGKTISREITPKSITRLSYTNNIGNPDFIPEDTGHGSGLIRITNNTTGVVSSVTIHDTEDLSKSFPIPYGDFTPPYPIQYAKVGRVPVQGTSEFPLREGIRQIIRVLLETGNGLVMVERVAALKGQTVDIDISEGILNPAAGRVGSKVTVRNETTTPTNILGMYVHKQGEGVKIAANPVYYLNIASPGPNQKFVYVLSGAGLSIENNQTYKATLSVYINGKIVLIEKEFVSDGNLYSINPEAHSRTVTLTQNDLPSEYFVPVTGLKTDPDPYIVNVYYETGQDGSKIVTYSGDFNFNNITTVEPSGATTKGPIEWTISSGGGGKVAISGDRVFSVNKPDGFVPEGNERTVAVTARIKNAGPAGADFTGTVKIQLVYIDSSGSAPNPPPAPPPTPPQPPDKKVTVFTLATNAVVLEEYKTLDLKTLVGSLSPQDAIINGAPVTTDDIEWRNTGAAAAGSISGSVFTAGANGTTVSVTATIPANKTDSGTAIQRAVYITIISANAR